MSSNGPVQRSKSSFDPITWGLAAIYVAIYLGFLFIIDTDGFLNTGFGLITAVVVAVVLVISFFVVRYVIRLRLKSITDQGD